MAKEYIERDTLIESIKRIYCADCNKTDSNAVYCENCGIAEALDIIADAPAADIAPVTHGEWKTEWDAEKDPKKYFIRIVCSNCGLKTGEVANYCPNCGAKMDGGKK